MKKQAMEWDADLFSFGSILNSRLNARKIAQARPQLFDRLYIEPDRLLSAIIIACNAFFRIFDNDNPAPQLWPYRSHPPSRHRRLRMMTEASLLAREIDPATFTPAILHSVLEKYVVPFEILVTTLWDLPSIQGMAELDINASNQHQLSTVAVWNSIVDALRKYSFVRIEKWPL